MEAFANGIRIFYEKQGEGSPLLLLHGNGETHEIFDKAVEAFSSQYTVYALDSRCHGKSEMTSSISYDEMAKDVADFIKVLQLEKPIICGFSDGGIVGLLLAIRYPERISRLIACGANATPSGLKIRYQMLFRLFYLFTREPKLKMMLDEPQITKEKLEAINLPVLLLAGEKDMIKTRHTQYLAHSIPGSLLHILKGETHESYVVHSPVMPQHVLPFLDLH